MNRTETGPGIRTAIVLMAALLLSVGAARAATYLVWTNGSQTVPYSTWGTAFSNIQDAIDYASDTDIVLVTNGTYLLSSFVHVSKGVVVTSAHGYASTIVDGNDTVPCFWLSNENAVVDGFTLTGGRCSGAAPERGAGAIIQKPAAQSSGGLLRNCRVTGNTSPSYYAGGVYVNGDGDIKSCIITNNSCNTYGAVLYTASGSIENCIISDNNGSGNGGGGISIWGNVTVRNCLVSGNSCSGGASHGGGIALESGSPVIENCTVSGNTSGGQGGGVYRNVGTILNSIIYFNTSSSSSNLYTAGTVSYTCVAPDPGGTSNITSNPQFVNAAAGDFHLATGSPCIGAAQSNAWMATATDLDGLARVLGGTPEMGAYEFDPSTPLGCDFTGAPLLGLEPLDVTFSALATGGDTNGLVFHWDFEDDGTNDATGKTVTNTYADGTFTVSCTASNGAGETALRTRTNYINVSSVDTWLVWTNGTQQAPYDTWAKAFSNIQDAVDHATPFDIILVTNGTYAITSDIVVPKLLTIRSVNGATQTVVRRSAVGTALPHHRIFTLTFTNTVLDGFTIENGYTTDALSGATVTPDRGHGAGVFMTTNCTLQNCLILNNTMATANRYGGGVICPKDGTISNCVIRGNSGLAWGGGMAFYPGNAGGTLWGCTIAKNRTTSYGGGGAMLYGTVTVRDCVVTNNRSGWEGGGLYFNTDARYSQVRNSLVAGNTAGTHGGGIHFDRGGSLENCTITGNTCSQNGGGLRFGSGSPGWGVTNSIVYFNSAGSAGPNYYTNGAVGGFAYSCTTPDPGGTSNVLTDPLLIDAPNDNYRLLATSPCIDKGTSNAWMSTATDLDGETRVRQGAPDMGAYEFSLGPLTCSFSAGPTAGFMPLSVVFTSLVAGADLNGIGYLWDFDNDANIDSQEPHPTNVYGPGTFTVVLSVTNAAGESNSFTRVDYITSGPGTSYVARLGWNTDTAPYTNWLTAASNINDAVLGGVDGTLVLVTNGIYGLSAMIAISNGLTVRSVNGYEVTTVNGNDSVPGFYIVDENAVVDGFTVTNCRGSGNVPFRGGGVNIQKAPLDSGGGTVQNCLITGNTVGVYSGGVYCQNGGSVLNCIIRNNKSSYGGVFLTSGSRMENCEVVGNTATTYGAGAAYIAGSATVRTCLMTGNTAKTFAGGVWMTGGAVDNCTIANNSIRDNAGGVYITGGTVENTIIRLNSAGVGDDNWLRTGGTIQYSCTTPDASAYGDGNVTGDPLFVNVSTGDYRLAAGSPCYNTGTNRAWMVGATDLDGLDRILMRRVDMGAYEFVPPMGTLFLLR